MTCVKNAEKRKNIPTSHFALLVGVKINGVVNPAEKLFIIRPHTIGIARSVIEGHITIGDKDLGFQGLFVFFGAKTYPFYH